jgi:NADH-quinone oxidoreductase subunit N
LEELTGNIGKLTHQALAGLPLLAPEIALAAAFLAAIFAELFLGKKRTALTFAIVLTGIGVSFALNCAALPDFGTEPRLVSSLLRLQKTDILFKLIFGVVTALTALFIRFNRQMREHKKGLGDIFLILPAVHIGMNLMAMSGDLLMIYLSVEMVSIASYLMVGYVSGDGKQTEAAMKYALFGSVCSAVMLYGMSLLYAFTGTLDISSPDFIAGLNSVSPALALLAIGLVLAGIGFKVSFVPVHFWSPDIYEGAPTPVTAFLSTGPKVAGFALLLKVAGPLGVGQEGGLFGLHGLLSAIAILTMVAGNFAAIFQQRVKRLLAYSSIAHTGFAIMAVVVSSSSGTRALIFYFAVYALMNMAAFVLAGRMEEQASAYEAKDYSGLGRQFKLEMFCFTIVLISLTGLPPTGGFTAKFLLFTHTLEAYFSAGSPWMLAMTITGAVTTLVSLFYYIRLPLYAYLRPPAPEHFPATPKPGPLGLLVVLLSALIVVLGIFPGLFGGLLSL